MSAGFMVSNIFSTILRALCPLLFMFLVFKLVEFAVKIWWIPLTLTKFMEKQGIRGPPYKFLHGNNKEVGLMVMESSAKPMDFSHDIFPRVQPHFYSWIKIHGSVLLCWLGPKPQLIVTDPELIREILNNKRGDFQKPKKNSIVKRLLGDGLVSANGEKWVRHRKLANKAFNGESLRDIVDECKTFYLAGHETTSALLTWTVVLLAMHPEWQERARKEVIQVLGSNTPSIDGLAQLKIMNMLINESLRLYPPVLFLTKASIRKVRVGKFTIPSGMELVVPPLAAYHDPSQWGDDVNLFKPERFAQGVTTAASTQVSFIPFGYGPRICVGLNFATLEAKVALSMILRCYTFTLSPSYQHAPALRITMGPQHGAPIIIHSQ
ncbi:cytochrome P450 CYP749A22 isoform X5 [Amborella trichopoda]|uniref:cytochrome P450 CYP749A22 isoform X5 n=1 Tax=Amborella trichopoda TaxID=13333 RepID=UPI0009BEC652|nr:cytochrome P450 CYP749A22 isoform X5 [Amborella trichopoda]|eukprot:XP_020530439.1 cytochrome P450 CYP749A22 isoform X5 [Amborella trichopoda]